MSNAEVQMRGLTNFITEIRRCKTREAEVKRVEKELANIRAKFGAAKKLDIYNKKKYTWKLLYIHLLGYDVEIGHMEALQMVTAQTYTEKNVGYLACSVLLNENSELLRLIIQSVKNDLLSKNDGFQCLALNCIGNVGGQEFAESLTGDVQNLVTSSASSPFVKKKASLALLRLFRKFPEAIPSEQWASKVLAILDDNNLGVLVAVSALIVGLVSHNPKGYEEVVSKAARLLTMLVINYYVNPRDAHHPPHIDQRHRPYSYWHTMSPWLQIKMLRLLQFFPPPSDPSLYKKLNEVFEHILSHIEVTKNVSKNNADHAILFECLNTIIHYCVHGRTDLQKSAVDIIARFISVKEPNIRYLGLDAMARLAKLPGTLSIEGFKDKKRFTAVKVSLTDPDISIRKRALDLMYAMCDKSNAEENVGELVGYLQKADYEIKEELVLKIAILAEKFPTTLRWYVDVILQLITLAGEHVSEDIWYRVVQIVTNNDVDGLQEYTATTMLKALQSPDIHESGIKVGGYILGEFGHSIKNDEVTGAQLLKVLYDRFPTCSAPTKALLLSSFIKMANTYPELKGRVEQILQAHKSYVDLEIQQRAVEYSVLNSMQNDELLNQVFEIMPSFPQRESALLKRIRKAQAPVVEEKGEEESDTEDAEAPEDAKDEDFVAQRANDGLSDEEVEDAPRAAAEIDLLGIAAGSTGGGSRNAFPEQTVGTLDSVFGKAAGVVYDSDKLQIGVKIMANAGSQCKMILYYGNKTDSDFTDLTAELPAYDHLRVQIRPQEPIVVGAKQQVPHYLLWHSLRPFVEAPSIALRFVWNGHAYNLTLTLPVYTAQFCKPGALDGSGYIGEWKALGNGETKVIKGASVVDVEQLKSAVREALGATVFEGLEPEPANFSAATTFCTASKGPSGEPVDLLVLYRFETKANSPFARVSVRSPQPLLSNAAIKNVAVLMGAEHL